MKFPQRQVADPRAQQNFEQLQGLFPIGAANIAAGAVDLTKLATGIVLELAVGGTQRKVAFGTSTVTFTASAASAEVTVPHGLGRTPVTVLVSYRHAPGSTIIFSPYVGAVDATNIFVSAVASTSLTGPLPIDWVVIG